MTQPIREQLEKILATIEIRAIAEGPINGLDDIHEEAEAAILALITQLIKESKPKTKTITLDRPLDVDDGEQFCVECGQWTYEGELDCKCMGYNQALDDYERNLLEGLR